MTFELRQVERRPTEVRTPGAPLAGVRRLVVSRHDRLGDVVLSLPAIVALRRAYPAAHLALLVRPPLGSLARMVGGVDEVLEAGAGGRALCDQLRRFGADLVVCISRGPAVPWAAARARVPHRIGPGHRFYSPLFSRRVDEHRRAGARHELEYALSFAHRAGAPPGPASFPLRLPAPAVAAADHWLARHALDGRPFVLVHPGSSGSCPAWPVDHHLRLAALVATQGLPVALSIGPADGSVATRLEQAPDATRRLPRSMAGIEELAALLQRAAVVVSNSTGPLHLAAALGTPTLGFYPPGSSCGVTRWGPYAPNGWALVARALAEIPPEAALACVHDLVAGRSPRRPADAV